MPTPPLVLRSLLAALSLDIGTPTLSSASPTLLLLILEILLGRRLPYAHPTTISGEVALVKCVIGVLATEISLDLSIVDPLAVIAGDEGNVAAVVMALAVLARRKGIILDLNAEDVSDHSLIDEPVDEVNVAPLEPAHLDMYTTPPRRNTSSSSERIVLDSRVDRRSPTEYPRDYQDYSEELRQEHTYNRGVGDEYKHSYSQRRIPSQARYGDIGLKRRQSEYEQHSTYRHDYDEKYRSHDYDDQYKRPRDQQERSWSNSYEAYFAHIPSDASRSSQSSGPTVLQTLLDEFGLPPE